MYRSLLCCIVLSALYCCKAIAQGFGEVAGNLYEPVSIIIQLVRAVSIICGGGLVLGSVLRYVDYRKNPMAVRLSTVTFMFFFGVSLIIVGLIPLHTYDS